MANEWHKSRRTCAYAWYIAGFVIWNNVEEYAQWDQFCSGGLRHRHDPAVVFVKGL